MNPVAVAFAIAGLATVAGAGVVAGFLRDSAGPLDPPDDPLQDLRATLRRSLSDLEEARSSGALDEPEYERLRSETETRVARVDRAIDRRSHATGERVSESGGTSVLTDHAPAGPATREPRRVPAWAVSVLIGGTALAVVVASMARQAEPRAETAAAPEASDDGLAFFERRVEEQPNDLAARLDLAHRYLDAGMLTEALGEYAVALELDPDDAEAHAHVGIIMYISERPQAALVAVDRALATDPTYPEALFFRGVILLKGLDRPGEAIDALERYLDAAPFGVERENARSLIAEAQEALAGR